jgi:hypothetical protein
MSENTALKNIIVLDLQPFVGPWPLLQFLKDVREHGSEERYCIGSAAFRWALAASSVSEPYSQLIGHLGRGSACREATAYTQDNTNTE